MRSKIHIRIIDENNISQASFNLSFATENMLDWCLEEMLEIALTNYALLQPEMVTYDLSINGVKLEKTK